MHKSPRPPTRQSDVASMAMRIMSEREADHSDDYAALLDRLIRSPGGLKGRGQVRVEGSSPIVDLGTPT